MVDKLHEYEGWTGRAHAWRDSTREHFRAVKSSWTPLRDLRDRLWGRPHPPGISGEVDGQRKNNDFLHIYRRKTRKELVRISAAVMGIEFSYAGETAFVSPTLLKIGVAHQHMTLVWALSPLVGFFLTPILGSLSDRCRSIYGRRRPFIVLLSVGVLLGLLLVPNGEDIGYSMGDFYPYGDDNATKLLLPVLPHRTSANKYDTMVASNVTSDMDPDIPNSNTPHPWGVFFTILGTVLLDFDADACQSPSRAYLLDVTVPEDHARGLSTFTIMAGLGGFFGYGLGGINWDATAIGVLFGGHVRAVFSLITIIFIVCVSYTISSFSEIPLDILEDDLRIKEIIHLSNDHTEKALITNNGDEEKSYGTANNAEQIAPAVSTNPFRNPEFLKEDVKTTKESSDIDEPMNTIPEEDNLSLNVKPETEFEQISLKHYLMSILIMPFSLRIVCVTNLFSWMAHVCYSLYFTDFVGEAVFLGNPAASEGTLSRDLYEEGVRFGCWGMSMYSLSCACYSLVIEKLIKRYGAKKVYVGGLLTNSLGMMLMALTKHRAGVIIFSWTAGVMYSTLFTMPYLLVAHYHARGTFEVSPDGEGRHGSQLRGLGTDVAIVSSMVFLAQFILSMCMGSIVSYSGTTTAVVSVASCLAFFSAVSATQIMYLDL